VSGTSFASSFGAVLALALGLAMDATAAAAACGVAAPAVRARHYASVAAYFGGFQALMPLLGWRLAAWLGPVIEGWDHWIAFVLLSGIGAKMIHGAWRGGVRAAGEGDGFGPKVMLGLAVATSIDAFAVGVTLPMIGAPLAASVATIGVTTAMLSVGGLFAGRSFGALLGRRLEALGGLVLIALGGKILVEHLTAR